MTRPNTVDITILLDRSGSMSATRNDTIGGFNEFIEEQRKVPGQAVLTLIQFDDQYDVNYVAVPLDHVANLTTKTYEPRGNTALLDAMARAIRDTGERLSKMPEQERPAKVIMLIMTDGMENTSKDFSPRNGGHQKIKDMVTHQKNVYSWEFVFIGANIDSFGVSEQLNFSSGSTINYTSSPIGTRNAFKSLSRGVGAVRICAGNGGATTNNFFEEERTRGGMIVISDTKPDTDNIQLTIDKYKSITTGTINSK